MIIVVVSGKGGAGKTTFSAALAKILPPEKLILVDADVDTPNLALALGLEEPEKREEWWGGTVAEYVGDTPHPEACPFGAIREDGTVNELLCEGCGACAKRFPQDYRVKSIHTADILEYRWNGVPLITAELLPGRSGSGKIVTEIRMRAATLAELEGKELTLIDAAAGRGCPVIASVRGSDAAILVIDNTPTGISDAEYAVEVLKHFNTPFFFVINRYDLCPERVDKIVERFEKQHGGTFIGKIPYLPEVMRTYPVRPDPILENISVEEILKMI